jgi:ubiquinone/menaquinone biosynthesis C-methylase UbiE
MENNINDYDKFAEKRQQDLINGMKPSHRFVEKPMMKSMIPNLKNKKVLMLGCGTGEESNLLKTFGASLNQLTGIDVSSKSIEIAKRSYPDIEFVVGDMNELPFENESFDFVYSSLAIHYSATPEKTYKEVYRVLKKDGLFLFSVGHPLRWSSEEQIINDETSRIIGCSKSDNGNKVYGKYNSFEKHIFSSFAWQNDNEVLSFYVGSPSMHFKLLRQVNFEILDFTESKCVEEAKTVDMNYYIKNSEIPQFMAFLAKK